MRVAGGYLNLDANASNPYRDYAGGGAIVGLGITLWATPTFGVKVDYASSVAAHVRDRRASFGLDHQDLDASLVHRRAWAKSLVDFSVGYHQVSNRVTRSLVSPLGSLSQGADLGVGWTRAQTDAYAHTAELHLQPFLGHRELGLSNAVTSGGSNTSFGGSLAIGGQYAVDHDRDVFWRARYTLEQNIFSPGPTVTTGQALLILGAQWGS